MAYSKAKARKYPSKYAAANKSRSAARSNRMSYVRNALSSGNRGSGPEKKNFDTQIFLQLPEMSQTATFTINGALSPNILDIEQGTTANQRVGRKITLVKWNFRGFLQMSGGALSVGYEYMRIMFVWDKQCNGAIPDGNEVLATLRS